MSCILSTIPGSLRLGVPPEFTFSLKLLFWPYFCLQRIVSLFFFYSHQPPTLLPLYLLEGRLPTNFYPKIVLIVCSLFAPELRYFFFQKRNSSEKIFPLGGTRICILWLSGPMCFSEGKDLSTRIPSSKKIIDSLSRHFFC